MRPSPSVSPDAFWTSHSLVLPFTESTHSVGGYLVGIRAQTEDIVAIVERVNSDGSVLISEGGTGFSSFPAYETIYGTGNYQYIHY